MDWYYKQHDVITETVYLVDNELTMRNLVRANVDKNQLLRCEIWVRWFQS